MSENEIDAKINDVAARLGEHFEDYLILARTSTGIAARYTDQTWAMGAMQRFNTGRDETDRIQSRIEAQNRIENNNE